MTTERGPKGAALVKADPARYDPLTSETTNDPFVLYARLREEVPVYLHPVFGWWVVSRHEDVAFILSQPETFILPQHLMTGTPPPEVTDDLPEGYAEPMLMMSDPPMHARVRKLTNQIFKPARSEARAPEIATVADRLIDDFVHEGHTDLVASFAAPLPLIMIARILGLPEPDLGRIEHWSDNSFALTTARPEGDALIRAWQEDIEYFRYVEELVEERRRAPRESDLLTDLITARLDDGSGFTAVEVIKLVQLIITAGNETTRQLIGTLVLRLLEHPDQLAAVRAEPSIAAAAVEEALRHSGPVKGVIRMTTEEVKLGDVTIPEGQILHVLVASANRDETGFASPDEFDLHRVDASHHMGFGRGMHFCLGAALARTEARIALQRVVARLPDLRRIGDEPPEWTQSIISFGLTRLDVEWDPDGVSHAESA